MLADCPLTFCFSKANEYARNHGLRQFSIYQGRWSAACRDLERDILPMCKAEGMGIAPWGSLGGGNFKSEETRRLNEGRKSEASDADIKISLALEAIAHRKNTAITSIALAYVMQKAPYVFPVVGGRKVEHLKANVEALTIELSDEDIEEIEAAVPFDLGFPHNFLWGKQLPKESLQDIWLLSTAGSFDHVAEVKVRASEFVTHKGHVNLLRLSPYDPRRMENRAPHSGRFAGDGCPTDQAQRQARIKACSTYDIPGLDAINCCLLLHYRSSNQPIDNTEHGLYLVMTVFLLDPST